MGDKLERTIGVGEYIITNNEEDVLKIYGLASCLGVVMYCPAIKLLGIAHFLLPSSSINPDLGKISPAYFVDTGMEILVHKICRDYGFCKEKIEVSIYGGAEARSENDIFNIGNRNVKAVKEKLNEYRLKLKYSDTGGRVSRTLAVSVRTGKASLILQQAYIL